MQNFLKRYRKWLNSHKIRYAYCGEYGEKGDRPHYHALIFGHDFTDKNEKFKVGEHLIYTSAKLDELWGLGHCSIGNVTFDSAAYVARYVTKKVTGKKAAAHYGELLNKTTGELTPRRIPEFFETSRRPGLGRDWYEKYKSEVINTDSVLMNGKEIKPPKYYNNRIEIDDPEAHFRNKAARTAAAKNNPDNNFTRRLVLEELKLIESSKLKRNYES